jgi:vancomycin resistance protein YoaR
MNKNLTILSLREGRGFNRPTWQSLIFLFFPVFIFLFIPKTFTRAAGFEFKYKDTAKTVSQEELDSWQAKSLLPGNDLLKKQKISLSQLMDDFFFFQTNDGKSISEPISNFDAGKIYSYIETLSKDFDKDVVEPDLTIKDQKAASFTPPQNGIKTDVYASTLKTLDSLKRNQEFSDLEIRETTPQKSLSQLNDLGINELISRGESNFSGSPKNRIHNIKIGVEKMKGILIMPGEEFSFNDHLGPVEEDQGFLPELVIKKTGTVPELGGGLCQVSSTTFRAAMNAGLPITERRNHAYAVQYYAPQGTDATIYPGVVDLKFTNNTPGAILIWPHIEEKNNLYFDFYGSRDDRKVVLEKPVQYDKNPDGSMKASWTREVFNNGTTTTDTFKSTYLPPALFHKPEATSTASSISSPAPASLN